MARRTILTVDEDQTLELKTSQSKKRKPVKLDIDGQDDREHYVVKPIEVTRQTILTVDDNQTLELKTSRGKKTKPVKLDVDEAFIIGRDDDREHYKGTYVVEPDFAGQTLETAKKIMDEDVVVEPIEVARTSNPAGGKTVYIGGII